ncbi:MAG: sigma 54-interacting transcriptional regulator [Planctomycetaceae bacterium]
MAAPQLTSPILGRFEIIRELGRGAAGTLLLVKDLLRGGELCALKLLAPRFRDPQLEPLFRSEFLLLSSIRHKGIVAVRDFGVLENGQPFFTMQFVPGETCREYIIEDRLDANGLLDLAARLLHAVAHIHARGVLHRDIKPENVILSGEGEGLNPVLVDFGLALSAAAARPGEATGTVPYIAPEVLAGSAPDARADLFSLGFLLYETATGRQPAASDEMLRNPAAMFASDRLKKSMRQHGRSTVPSGFEEFVLHLLAPSPQGRYPTAADALTALAALYPDRVAAVDLERSLVPIASDPPLVGRRPALEALLGRVEALREGDLLDGLAVVAGSAGAGVSRLLAALRNHAAARGCTVFFGSSLRPFAREILASPLLGPPQEHLGEDPPSILFQIDTRLRDAPAAAFPVLLLDDLHAWSGEECAALRGWIGSLEQQPERARYLLVLGGRTEGAGDGALILRTAGRSVPVDLRSLPPLEATDVRAALSVILEETRPPATLAQALFGASKGHPRLLAGLLRVLAAERVIEYEAGRPVFREERLRGLRLPDDVADVFRLRAGKLAAKEQGLLARCALVPGPVGYAAGLAIARESLAPFLVEGLLVRDGGKVRFPDELSRAGADTLKGAQRRKALRELARSIEAEEPAAAARMLLESGDLAGARPPGLRAIAALRAERRLDEALLLAQRLDGEPYDPAFARAHADLLAAMGRWEDASRVTLALLEQEGDAPEPDDLFAAARALRNCGRAETALGLLSERGKRLPREHAARLHNAMAALLESVDRLEDAMAESRAAEAAAGSLLALNGGIVQARAMILRRMGRRNACIRLESQIVEADPDAVVPAVRARAALNRAVLYMHAGRLGEALRELRRTRLAARASGLVVQEALALLNLGGLFESVGRSARALKLNERCRVLFERSARMQDVARALAREAKALVELGRPAEAELRMAKALRIPGAGSHIGPGQSGGVASVLLRTYAGDAAEAVRPLERELTRIEEAGEASPLDAEHWADCLARHSDASSMEAQWRRVLRHAARARVRAQFSLSRLGLAEAAALQGAWNRAEVFVRRLKGPVMEWKTPVRARAHVILAYAALQRGDAPAAGRHIETAVAGANRADHVVTRAVVYVAAASLLQDVEMQKLLRRPTEEAAGALLHGARAIWALFGNQSMLRKIDLHLAELPRAGAGLGGSSDADRLVKILHVVREMNREFERDRLLALILDRAVELTGAERGFVVLLKEGQEVVHMARNIDREAVGEPDQKISSHIVKEVIRSGRTVLAQNAEADSRFSEFFSVRNLRLRSVIALPFRSKGKVIGALYLDNRFHPGNFSEREEHLLELFSDQAVAAIEKAQLIKELEQQREEISDLNRQLKAKLKSQDVELRHARSEIRTHRKERGWGFDRIVARSAAMQAVVREAKRFAGSELPVLLTGENGTGKELLARATHYASSRQGRAFVAVNCAAFTEGLLESELFGHVRGSFTGADKDRAGLFEEADGGTLFLDEVGDMAPSMQVRLLRALELGEIRRVGDSTTRAVDVRIIAATNADLDGARSRGTFREDLYYRLSGCILRVPPLRERLEDVEPLAYAFLDEAARREGRQGLSLGSAAIAKLESYDWPGNVRELRNVILRLLVTASGSVVGPQEIAFDARAGLAPPGVDPVRLDRMLEEVDAAGHSLNERQKTGISRVLAKGKLAFSEYANLFRISKSTAARDLEELVEMGLLEKRGKTRAVLYLPGAWLRDLAKLASAERDQ